MIDAAAFVNPRWNPLLGDGEEVVSELVRQGGPTAPITALVRCHSFPNRVGFQTVDLCRPVDIAIRRC
jgi:hypothetical protein